MSHPPGDQEGAATPPVGRHTRQPSQQHPPNESPSPTAPLPPVVPGQELGLNGASESESGGPEILRRIITYTPGSLIPAAITLATSMLFTRLFTAGDYGAFSLALVVATMLKTGLSNWLSLSATRFLPLQPAPEQQRHVKSALVLSTVAMLFAELLVGLVVVIAGPFLVDVQETGLVLPAMLYVLVTSTFEVLSAVFAAEHRAGEFVTYQLILSAVTFILRIILVSTVLEGEISLMFWSLVLTTGALVPVLWMRAGLAGPTPAALRKACASPEIVRLSLAFVKFGLPMTMWLVASVLMDVGDRFVINALLGPSSVGIYDANYRLVTGLVSLMIVPISITLYPYLMSISGSGVSQHIGLVIGVIVENLLILGTLAVGITFVFEQDLSLLLGPSFREGSVIMPIALAGVFAFHIGSFAHKPFEIVGRTGPMVGFAFAAAALNIVLNFTLIPIVGIIGAAYATLAAYVSYTASIGALGRRIYRWRIAGRATARIMVTVAVALVLIFGMRVVVTHYTPFGGFLAALGLSSVLGLWVLGRIRRSVMAVPRLTPTASKE